MNSCDKDARIGTIDFADMRDVSDGKTYSGALIQVARLYMRSTHFVNACVQKRRVTRVALTSTLFRLCVPATHALPTFCNLPDALRQAVGCHCLLLDAQCRPRFICNLLPSCVIAPLCWLHFLLGLKMFPRVGIGQVPMILRGAQLLVPSMNNKQKKPHHRP